MEQKAGSLDVAEPLNPLPSPSRIGDAKAVNPAVCGLMDQSGRIAPNRQLWSLAKIELSKIDEAPLKVVVILCPFVGQFVVNNVFDMRSNALEAPRINSPH
jgi:hypothetical protein